jgi:hypothetical protein
VDREPVDHLDQERVAGALEQHGVEFLVGLPGRYRVAALGRFPQPLVGRRHRLEVLVAQVAEGQLHGQLVQHAQRHVQQLGVLRAGGGHLGPGVPGADHEPQQLQALERLADRRAADPELGGDLGVFQHLAWLQGAILDPLLDLLHGERAGGGTMYRGHIFGQRHAIYSSRYFASDKHLYTGNRCFR